MKEDQSNADLKVTLAAVFLLATAVLCWTVRNSLPEFAAESVRVSADLSYTGEAGDARLNHAFEKNMKGSKVEAGLEAYDSDPRSLSRQSRLWVQAPTEAAALERLNHLIEGIHRDFVNEGGGELQIKVSKKAWPVPNPSMERLGLLMRGSALVLSLTGAGVLFLVWRRAKKGRH